MKRSAAVVLAVVSLLLAGLAVGTVGVRAGEQEGDGEERHVDREIEKRIEVVRLGGEGAFLGVGLDEVEGDARGAKVRTVGPESPAEKAGLQNGDVIVRFDGADVRSARQLVRLVGETPAGRVVPIEVKRAGAPRTLTATLGERDHRFHVGPRHRFLPGPEDFDVTIDVPAAPLLPQGAEPHVFRWHGDEGRDFAMVLEAGRPRLGIHYIEIEGQLADYFGLAADTGVLVTSVQEDGPAAKAGIRAGDVVLELDGRPVRDGGSLRKEVRRVEGGGPVAVKLQRDRKPLDVEVVLPEAKEPAERIPRGHSSTPHPNPPPVGGGKA
jgi:C-terminal processing protease CtpA/Prc